MSTESKVAVYESESLLFGELCSERKESTKKPLEDGLTNYVGLEHLVTDKVELSNSGSIKDDTPSFTKVFRAGDVLLCKRRPYLRKASLVHFDGICSGDIIVLKANTSLVRSELLPHLLHTAEFWNFAVKTSSGSLSPRTKFSSLKDFSLEVPKFKCQPQILSLIHNSMKVDTLTRQAIDNVSAIIKSYKNRYMSLGRTRGRGSKTLKSYLTESRVEGSNGKLAKKLTVKLYGRGIEAKKASVGSENTKYFVRSSGQFIYSKLDFLNGAFAVIPEDLDGYETTADLPAFDVSKKINPKWLFYYVSRPEFYERFIQNAKGGRKAKRISPKDFLAYEIPVLSLQDQNTHVEVLEELEVQKSLLLEKLACMRKVRQKVILGK